MSNYITIQLFFNIYPSIKWDIIILNYKIYIKLENLVNKEYYKIYN